MSSGKYEVRLADFQGSLDLLLHLVRTAKMNIEEIQLADITDQYLDYMNQVGEVDLERASDFLETASVLILIKSRALLPAASPAAPDEEADPEQELLERMRLYAMFQSAAEPLRRQAEDGSNYFYKPPEDVYNEEAEVRLLNADAAALRRTLQSLARRRREVPEPVPVHHVKPELYDVRLQKERILARLRQGPFYFADFFTPQSPLLEVVVSFMAVLELWALGALHLEQARPFASIEVRPEEGT